MCGIDNCTVLNFPQLEIKLLLFLFFECVWELDNSWMGAKRKCESLLLHILTVLNHLVPVLL